MKISALVAVLLVCGGNELWAKELDLNSLPQASVSDWPDWAYGYPEPVTETDPSTYQVPDCPETARPRSCGPTGTPLVENGVKLTLAGTSLSFTRVEANYSWGPADWYPGDHPEMPKIIAVGDQERGIRPCGLCHFPSGQGKIENGHVSGLPKAYFLQQLAAFAKGARYSADYRKANTNEMARTAATLTDEEKEIVAEYFSSIPYRSMVRVVESEQAPQTRASLNRLLIALEDKPWVPLGNKIVEVAEDAEETELARNPRGGFVAYVPVGSIAKGKNLVETGAGKTAPCGTCHNSENPSFVDIPDINGRTTSYTMRQLWDMKQGTRVSPMMKPMVVNLSADDMLNIVAYLATLPPQSY
jgi:cytochrome c553